MTFVQSSEPPFAVEYLSSRVLPWQDYCIFRSDNTTYCVIGDYNAGTFSNYRLHSVILSDDGTFILGDTSEGDSLAISVDYPLYLYGNNEGQVLRLPQSENLTCIAVCAAVIVSGMIALFRVIWGLKKTAG